jgi:putative isomerase
MFRPGASGALLLYGFMGFAIPAVSSAQPSSRPGAIRTESYRRLQEKLCRGWNTWNTNSVMSHVHLPEGFAVTLGLKVAGIGRPYQNTFFQANATLKRAETVRLGTRSDDGAYTELTCVWDSDTWRKNCRNRFRVQTAVENDELHILVTVQERDLMKPPNLIVEAGMLWNRPGCVTNSGDVLTAQAGGRTFEVRGTSASSGDPFVTSNSPILSFPLDGEIGICTGGAKSLDEIKAVISTHERDQQKKDAGFGDLSGAFRAMQTILAWNAVYDPENNRVISPVSRLWNANWGGYVLFDWDTYFAGFMYALYDRDLAYANAVEVTKGITAGGFIPNCNSAYGIKSDDRSQPPVGSTIILKLYRRFGERWLLEEVFDELLTWNRWWPRHRDNGGLLCWGSDPAPGQSVDGIENSWQAALFESGLDNSPMYDGVPFNRRTHLLEMADVGLTSFYIADCNALAEIAKILGKNLEAGELEKRSAAYRKALQTLWDDKTGMFLNRRTDTGESSPRLSPTNFYPLLARAATPEQAERMIRGHYFNSAEFHGRWMIPSIARNDTGFKDQSYWRGRIWAPMNFLVYLGLCNYDLPEARKDLVQKSLDLLMLSWKEEGAIYENYNAVTGRGSDVTSSDAFYHWGALLGVISFMERGFYDRVAGGK